MTFPAAQNSVVGSVAPRSAGAFSDGFVAAIGVAAVLSLVGALSGAALPGRRPRPAAVAAGSRAARV